MGMPVSKDTRHRDGEVIVGQSANASQAVVCYRLRSNLGGVTLEFWEPLPTSQAVTSYRFRLSCQFATTSEAQAALRRYLATTAAIAVVADQGETIDDNDDETTLFLNAVNR